MTEESYLQRITQSIVDGELPDAVTVVQEALAAQVDPLLILNEGLMKGADQVGDLFGRGEIYLPELMLAGRALKAAMDIVRPQIPKAGLGEGGSSQGKVVIATVQSDIHDIGKSLVASMLTAAGFDLIDLGVDVPIKSIIDKAEEVQADIVALSALLTTSMPYIADVVEQLKARGLRQKYFVIVGGASVTPAWAESIGADATAANAIEAVRVCRQLMAVRVA